MLSRELDQRQLNCFKSCLPSPWKQSRPWRVTAHSEWGTSGPLQSAPLCLRPERRAGPDEWLPTVSKALAVPYSLPFSICIQSAALCPRVPQVSLLIDLPGFLSHHLAPKIQVFLDSFIS